MQAMGMEHEDTARTLPARTLDERISVDPEHEVLEIDLSHLVLEDSAGVGALYDAIERRIAASGKKWFLLVNYLDCVIHPAAWIAFANRGKQLNLRHGLGAVRYNTREEIGAEIARRADAEAFEANLHANREAALDQLARLRAAYYQRHPDLRPVTPGDRARFAPRVTFDEGLGVMDVDFSEFVFEDADKVDRFYNVIEERIGQSGRTHWYFVVNYRHCTVLPEAWVAFANRGKRLNLAHSLGSVRYAAPDRTAAEIAERAATERFDANICESREEALARVAAMRAPQSRPAPRR